MHYRDKSTGRFVKESTYNRSRAQGGTRYKREVFEREKKAEEKRAEEEPEEIEEDDEAEYTGAFDSP